MKKDKTPNKAVLVCSLFIQAEFISLSAKTLLQDNNPTWKIICASIGGGVFIVLFILTFLRLYKKTKYKE